MYRFVPDYSQTSEKGAEEPRYILVCKKKKNREQMQAGIQFWHRLYNSSARGSECLALQR